MTTAQYKEAFCLMWYTCQTCGHLERIWNSRDGVTPFATVCPSCGDEMRHVYWSSDKPVLEHKLHYGQKFWRDGTPDEAVAIMRSRIAQQRNAGRVLSHDEEEQIVASVRSGNSSEFREGWPMLDVFLR